MKIAIWEPDLRVCGLTTVALNARTGLRQAGVQADLVAATKSGKPRKWWGARQPGEREGNHLINGRPLGMAWYPIMPDVVCKYEDLVPILSTYDFIFLPEPKSARIDRDAVKNNEALPWYSRIVEESGRPWFTWLGGPQYGDRFLPHHLLQATLAVNGGPRIVLSPSPSFFTDSGGPIVDMLSRHVFFPNPYELTVPYGAELPSLDTAVDVFTSGRVAPNKGAQTIAVGAEWEKLSVELWGAASTGLGPNFTFSFWEILRRRGWEGERFGIKWDDSRPVSELCGPDCCGDGYRHTPLNPFPWELNYSNGSQVRYRGSYGTESLPVGKVHFNFTAGDFSNNIVEYTTLEAMDLGALPVVPHHMKVGEYLSFSLGPEDWMQAPVPYGHYTKEKTLPGAEQQSQRAAAVVQTALEYKDRQAAVEWNRWLIHRDHSPLKFAQTVLASL